MTIAKQETFDKVVAHIRKQGKPAINSRGHCKYRTKEGLMCAAGCLIPDEEYSFNIERVTVSELKEDDLLPPSLEEHNLLLVNSLQGCHDVASNTPHRFLEIFERMVEEVAEKYNLSYSPPE